MKMRRFLSAVALFAVLIGLTGCYNANWSFSFIGIEEGDLSTFTVLQNGSSTEPTLTTRGVILDNMTLLLPISAADMKATLEFDLEVDESHTVDMSFSLASDRTGQPVCSVIFEGQKLGNDAEYAFWAGEGGDLGFINNPANTPSPNVNGSNTMVIEKKGDIYTGRLNGKLIYRFTAVYCEEPLFIPAFFSRSDGGNIYFTNISVDYSL